MTIDRPEKAISLTGAMLVDLAEIAEAAQGATGDQDALPLIRHGRGANGGPVLPNLT